jgi:hypothetical protein
MLLLLHRAAQFAPMSARKPTHNQRLRHALVGQWRGVEDGPLIDLPTKTIHDVLGRSSKTSGSRKGYAWRTC